MTTQAYQEQAIRLSLPTIWTLIPLGNQSMANQSILNSKGYIFSDVIRKLCSFKLISVKRVKQILDIKIPCSCFQDVVSFLKESGRFGIKCRGHPQ